MIAQTLSEKYRPRTLADIRGQALIVRCLSAFARRPVSKAFVFAGPPGTGKTSAAYAMARELGCDVEKKEWGGVHEIASGELTAETVREMFMTTMRYSTWHGSGWKVLIANEADNMSDKAAYILLDVLEHLPARCVVIFTTNNAEKLSRRFRERCECYSFKAATCQELEQAAQELIAAVWQAELGHNHAPKLADLPGAIKNGELSFRAVLRQLEPLIRAEMPEESALAPVADRMRVELPRPRKFSGPVRVVAKVRDSLDILAAAASRAAQFQTA